VDGCRADRPGLVAAAANGGNVTRKDGKPFTAADFLPPDPWEKPKPPPDMKAQIAAEIAAMEDLFG